MGTRSKRSEFLKEVIDKEISAKSDKDMKDIKKLMIQQSSNICKGFEKMSESILHIYNINNDNKNRNPANMHQENMCNKEIISTLSARIDTQDNEISELKLLIERIQTQVNDNLHPKTEVNNKLSKTPKIVKQTPIPVPINLEMSNITLTNANAFIKVSKAKRKLTYTVPENVQEDI